MTEGQEKSTPQPQLPPSLKESMRHVMENHTRYLSSGTGKITTCECGICKEFGEALRSVAGGEPPERVALRNLIEWLEDDTLEIMRDTRSMGIAFDESDCDHLREQIDLARKALDDEVAGGEPEQWISVEERMPDDSRPVWVHGGVAVWECPYWWTLMEPDRRIIQWPVTHWMPLSALPAPPQGKEQK